MTATLTKYGLFDYEITERLTEVYIRERLKGKGPCAAHTAVSEAAQSLGVPVGRAWDYTSFVQDRVDPPRRKPASREELERMLRLLLQPGAHPPSPQTHPTPGKFHARGS
jgi:hypothetical protein